jgi:pimeloyl-ACP methyl ester carboxylesterase
MPPSVPSSGTTEQGTGIDMDLGHGRPAHRARVLALHCSGAGAGQWQPLAQVLGGGYELLAPEHYGCDSAGAWGGERAFTLADEAARSLALIDRIAGKVHLVGHSYGGGVALHIAMARPERIASLALYEPSAFSLLRQMGGAGAAAFAEISGVARAVGAGVTSGNHLGAATAFVDYWNGPGAWRRLKPAVQAALVRWLPKAPLDFHALFNEPVCAHALACLRLPVLLLRGEHAPLPTRVVIDRLEHLLPAARVMTVAGAGHMGPITHAAEVSALMAGHIAGTRVP